MIALAADCLLIRRSSGESVPFSAEMIAVEVTGDSTDDLETELVSHAAKAVFHYFKHELSRQTVTVGEFTEALEAVLRGVGLKPPSARFVRPAVAADPYDLSRLAREVGPAGELLFFARVREHLRQQLRLAAPVVHFCALRAGVKQLTASRRWTPRCRALEEQILGFLRECLAAEAGAQACSLVVR